MFKMELGKKLRKEILSELEELEKMRKELGTEQHKAAVDGIAKLADRAIELEKIELDRQTNEEEREFNQGLKLREVELEKRNRATTNAIAIAGIVIPSLITVWGTLKTLNFEKEGTVTTILGRGFINKLLPKGK